MAVGGITKDDTADRLPPPAGIPTDPNPAAPQGEDLSVIACPPQRCSAEQRLPRRLAKGSQGINCIMQPRAEAFASAGPP